MAARRALRVRMLLPRPVSRCCRNPLIIGASSWAKSSLATGVPVAALAWLSSSRIVSPIGGDGGGARASFVDQPFGEEQLHAGGDRGHEASRLWCSWACSLAAASAISSGAASRYQYVWAGDAWPRY